MYGSPSPELTEVLKKGHNTLLTKKALRDAQHGKCAWCEMRYPLPSNMVEHYRPKDGAWRHLPGETERIDHGHYWWLAWNWENLLFSCGRCNGGGRKANYFPLESGSSAVDQPPTTVAVPLEAKYFDTSTEQPVLVNPAHDNPLDHIRWVPVNPTEPWRLWTWTPVGQTPRGIVTVEILKLTEMVDLVGPYLVECVLPGIEDVEYRLNAKKNKDARERWAKLLGYALAPGSQFSAASWCAIELWMPAAKRAQHGLQEPKRPGA
jgi:uncharacterized protein (TIGR02646 family)